MSNKGPDEKTFNFARVSVLLLDENQNGLDILIQVFTGFGVKKLHPVADVDEAKQIVENAALDLVIVDQEIADERGLEFIKWLRRVEGRGNASIPVIVPMGHTAQADVMRVRDAGASYVIRKPLSPSSLMQRIIMVVEDARMFIDAPGYAGPDRRFKFEGPPAGSEGRREGDQLDGDVGEPSGDNMAQDDIDALLKPRKVQL